MTDQEILQAMKEMFKPVNDRLDAIENNVSSLKKTAALVENDIMPKLQRTATLVENDIAPKVQVLLENHSDLAKNVMVAKDIEERVGTLEFEMRVVKNILKSKPI